MATNVEITWYFIDKNKAAESASFFICESLNGAIKHFLAASLSFRCLMPIFVKLFLFCIFLSVATLINMFDFINDISLLI